MNSHEIDALASIFKIKKWGGVWAADGLKMAGITLHSPVIVNCCAQHLPGIHWVAFYRISNNVFEIFDSSGSHPSVFPNIIIPTGWGEHCYYSDITLQDPSSDACGLYCLHYCLKRNRSKSLMDIVSDLLISEENLSLNDASLLHKSQSMLSKAMQSKTYM